MDAVANMVQQGQPAASGATSITVEKHKVNFQTQYGTFEDKPSQNIVRWLRKADKYQNAHMVPSLEMASIITHCIREEPAIKVKRWLDVPGENYTHSDHYNAQPEQLAVEYQPYQEMVQEVPGQPEIPAVLEQPHVPPVPADPDADPPVEAQDEIPFQPAVPGVPAVPFLTPPLRVRGVEVASGWGSVPSFFLSVRICVGVFTIPVIFSAYSNLLFDLGEMFDRSKDKPVLIMFSTVVEVSLTLTFLCVGGLLGNSVVRGCCAFFTGLPKEEIRFPIIVIDLMSELEL